MTTTLFFFFPSLIFCYAESQWNDCCSYEMFSREKSILRQIEMWNELFEYDLKIRQEEHKRYWVNFLSNYINLWRYSFCYSKSLSSLNAIERDVGWKNVSGAEIYSSQLRSGSIIFHPTQSFRWGLRWHRTTWENWKFFLTTSPTTWVRKWEENRKLISPQCLSSVNVEHFNFW